MLWELGLPRKRDTREGLFCLQTHFPSPSHERLLHSDAVMTLHRVAWLLAVAALVAGVSCDDSSTLDSSGDTTALAIQRVDQLFSAQILGSLRGLLFATSGDDC